MATSGVNNMSYVAHIGDLTRSQLAETVEAARCSEKGSAAGTLRINHNTFKVSIVNDTISLEFTSGNFFTNLFRGKTLARAQSKLQEIYDKNWATSADESNIEKLGKDVSRFVNYGFGDPRENAMRYKYSQTNAKGFTVDALNASLGIGEQFGLGKKWECKFFSLCEGLNETLNSEADPDIPEEFGGSTAAPLMSEVKGWRAFLQPHVGKLNMVDRLIQYEKDSKMPNVKPTGWAGMIQKFGLDSALERMIAKNAVGMTFDDVKECVSVLKELMHLDTTGLSSKQIAEKRDEIVNKNTKQSLNMLFTLRTFFFRQTSKLGLEFFAQQKIPVVFQMKTPGYDEKDRVHVSKSNLNDKWWKFDNLEEQFKSHEYGAPITNSEMRHVDRAGIRDKTTVFEVG